MCEKRHVREKTEVKKHLTMLSNVPASMISNSPDLGGKFTVPVFDREASIKASERSRLAWI